MEERRRWWYSHLVKTSCVCLFEIRAQVASFSAVPPTHPASSHAPSIGHRPVCLGCASFCNFRWSRLFVFGEQKVIWMPFSSALPMATATAADNGSTRMARSRYRTRLTRCPCRTHREMHATSGDVLHSLNSIWAYVASRA